MQSVTILGATGSIGLSTLDVMSRHTNDFCLYAVTGNTNVEGMLNICEQHKPRFAVMANDAAAKELTDKTKHLDLTVLSGPDALVEVASAPNVKIVMAAIVGGAGLLPTIAAAHAGKRICLANKEALVMSGQIFLDAVRKGGAELLPVDSEHNAIFQSLPVAVHQGASLEQAGVNKILLTGSGGPFLSKPLTEFEDITPAMAVAHPNWSMGAKISVDSATMMNKGLEFIEARLLFNARFEQIDVVIHPQSIIHSMVSYNDGSVLAQMGQPDMRTPIAHTLSYPERIESGVSPLDFSQLKSFTFSEADFERFPNLRLALEASQQGQGATTVLNAANEVAVEEFLNNNIKFTDIALVNEFVLNKLGSSPAVDLEQIIELDLLARAEAKKFAESASAK